MLSLLLLGVAAWVAISVPLALLFGRAFKLEESGTAAVSPPADVELDRINPGQPVEADLDWAGGADRLAQAG